MRFEALHLHDWGHFPVGHEVLLPAGGAGLQVLHGPNEAGKSTLLRAFTAALFGMAREDLSTYREIGARVGLTDGSTLAWRRIRQPSRGVPDPALARLLGLTGAVGREQWRQVFGFADADLARGAKALETRPLAQALDPDVDPDRARRTLDRAADDLYKAKAREVAVWRRAQELEGIDRRRREALVTPAAWHALSEAVREAAARAAETGEHADTVRRRADRIQRQLAARDALLRREQLRAERAAAPDPEGLLPDAAARYRRAAAALEAERTALRKAEQAVRAKAEELAGVHVDPEVIARAGTIRTLERAVLRVRDRATTLDAEAELSRVTEENLRRELAVFLPEVPLEEAPRRAPDARLLRRLEAFAGDREQARTTLVHATTAAAAAAAELDRRRRHQAEVVVPPWSPEWSAALAAAADAARATRIAGLEAEEKERTAEVRRLEAGLGGVPVEGSLAVLAPRLRPPSWADAWAAERDRLAARAGPARTRRDEALLRLNEAAEAVSAAESGGGLPSEEALAAARQARGESWSRVRRGLLEPGVIPRLEVVHVVDHHEVLVAEADARADALRAAAEAVSKRDQAVTRKAAYAETLRRADADVEEAERALAHLDAAWQEAWAAVGITPLDPVTMARWTERVLQWHRAETARADTAARLAAERAEAAAADARLAAALGAAGLPTAGLPADRVARAREAERSHHQARDRWEERSARVGEAEDRHARDVAEATQAAARFEAADHVWREALRTAGASPEDTDAERLRWPAEVEKKLAEVQAWAAQRRRWENDRDAVAEARAACRRELVALGPVAAGAEFEVLAAVVRRLADAEAAQVELARAESVLRERERGRAECATRVDALTAELQALRAGRDEAAWLPLADAAARRAALDTELAQLERELAPHRSGDDPTAFDAGALAADRVELERLAEDASTEARRAGALHATAQQELGSARNELDRIRPERTVADLVEDEHVARTALRAEVREWLVTRLARRLLDRAVAEREKDHLPQVVARASALFATVTGGRYRGIEERGGSWVALLADGTTKDPDALSDATRQQVFLAARLAWAELHNLSSEPLPLVLDDVLSAFDEARARVALHTLAAFAERQQVILLTHHAYVRDLAAGLPGAHLTELPGPR